MLIFENQKELVDCAEEFIQVCREAGLKVNSNNTKIISNARKEPVIVTGERIEWTREMTYLGKKISFDNARGRQLVIKVKNN